MLLPSVRSCWTRSQTRAFSSTPAAAAADFTHAVIGGGVVGLAIARKLAQRDGTSTILLERHDGVGTETSSRNSEVIHAGLYYPPNSLKTSLCLKGKPLLYSLLAEHSIPHRRTKKWIVAQNDKQMEHLHALHDHAKSVSVPTSFIPLDEAHRREPEVRATKGVLESPTTGILDSHALMQYLQGSFEDAGGDTALMSSVTGLEALDGGRSGYRIETLTAGGPTSNDATSMSITAETLINSTGLGACTIANMLLPPARYVTPHYAKGTYYAYAASTPKPSTLIYPAPEPGHAGLGTHLTLDMAGAVRFGPDVEWVDSPHDLTPRADRLHEALAEVRKYLPGIREDAVSPDYCGIRPKLSRAASGVAGKGFEDFVIRREEGFEGWVNLLGIESPGLTSCLAIADKVDELLYH
ncbi:MAG: hypothetical protein M1825_004478 [Sarcosagium campestre]|nr:MAG: hypothetical protein M1825_004478 [Sarcosagium campestre]